MDPQRPDELSASSTSATTSVHARAHDVDNPSSADTAAMLPAVADPTNDDRDSDRWLPRVSLGLAGESLPATSSGSYARLYASPGPDENHRAALSYFPFVGLAFLLDKRGSFYLRFHAAQGLALTLVALALAAAHWLIFGVLDSVPSLAMVFVEIALTWLFGLVCVTLAGLWLWGIVAALIGKDPSLPMVGRVGVRILDETLSRAS